MKKYAYHLNVVCPARRPLFATATIIYTMQRPQPGRVQSVEFTDVIQTTLQHCTGILRMKL